MNDLEIKTFIVKRIYGNVSLEDALLDRINDLQWFSSIVTKANEAIKRRK